MCQTTCEQELSRHLKPRLQGCLTPGGSVYFSSEDWAQVSARWYVCSGADCWFRGLHSPTLEAPKPPIGPEICFQGI